MTMTEAEITSFILFGLGLTLHIAFQTLRRINYDYLTTLPREYAMEHMEDVADDVLMEGIQQKLDVLCDKAGAPRD